MILTVKIISYLLIVFIASVVAGGAFTELFPNFKSDLFGDQIGDWLYNAIMSFGMAVTAVAISLLFRKYLDVYSVSTVGLHHRQPIAMLLKGGVWAIGIQSLAFLLLMLVQAIGIETTQFEFLELLGFLLFFLFVSIHEEVIFRGYLTSLLAQKMHFIPAVTISSLLFGAIHMGNVDFTWMGFGSIFFGGYLLGILFLKYKNLYLPIGMHWLWNYYQGNILGFDVSGLAIPAFLQLNLRGPDWLTGGEFGLEGSLVTVGLLLLLSVYLTKRWYPNLLVKSTDIDTNPDAPNLTA